MPAWASGGGAGALTWTRGRGLLLLPGGRARWGHWGTSSVVSAGSELSVNPGEAVEELLSKLGVGAE
jgi:hypothetical protein